MHKLPFQPSHIHNFLSPICEALLYCDSEQSPFVGNNGKHISGHQLLMDELIEELNCDYTPNQLHLLISILDILLENEHTIRENENELIDSDGQYLFDFDSKEQFPCHKPS